MSSPPAFAVGPSGRQKPWMPEPDEAQADGPAPESDADLLLFALKKHLGIGPRDWIGPNAVQYLFGVFPDVTERAVAPRSQGCVRDGSEYRGCVTRSKWSSIG